MGAPIDVALHASPQTILLKRMIDPTSCVLRCLPRHGRLAFCVVRASWCLQQGAADSGGLTSAHRNKHETSNLSQEALQ